MDLDRRDLQSARNADLNYIRLEILVTMILSKWDKPEKGFERIVLFTYILKRVRFNNSNVQNKFCFGHLDLEFVSIFEFRICLSLSHLKVMWVNCL